MERSLDDIPGNKMMNKLKTFLKAYRDERYRQNVSTIENPKTGLSPLERLRLLKYPEFTTGTAIFFGQEFIFSHGPSMVHSVDEIFSDEIYKFDTDTQTPYIIDCGANIGLSIYYFKKLFPNSKILAFEPDKKIFDILQKNVGNLKNNNGIEIREQAVWKENTMLQFYSEGALAGSSVTDFGKNNNVIEVKAVDLNEYLQTAVDFLKIDIEGAENEVIFHIKDSLGNVKNLFLEYHGIIGEEQNLGEILNLLKERGFCYYIRLAGETIQYPFCKEEPTNFNQQLNILCYRR